MIRVVHLVTPTFGSVFSGHTHYLFSLLSGWNDREISLDLLGTPIKPLNLNSGDPVYRLPPESLWSSPKRLDRWGRIRWSVQLLGMLIGRRKEYDVAHFHVFSWGSFLSPLILHLLGKKVVFTMSLFGNDNPGYIRQQPRGRLQVALLRRFDGAIGPSPALVNDAINHGIPNVVCLTNFLAIPQLEETVDNIQEIRKIARTHLGIPPGSLALLFVGSIIRRKGVDILIDSFIELAGTYPSLVLILVGPQSKKETTGIDEIFVSRLKEKIKEANLESRVYWAGMVKEQSKLVNYYRAADLFVFPTRNEGSPNVLAEAMSAGLPVVASLLPGITDAVVSDGESGCLVAPDDASQFTQAIGQLLGDEKKRKEMGAAGRRISVEKFGFTAYCQKLGKFYGDLFIKKGGAHG